MGFNLREKQKYLETIRKQIVDKNIDVDITKLDEITSFLGLDFWLEFILNDLDCMDDYYDKLGRNACNLIPTTEQMKEMRTKFLERADNHINELDNICFDVIQEVMQLHVE